MCYNYVHVHVLYNMHVHVRVVQYMYMYIVHLSYWYTCRGSQVLKISPTACTKLIAEIFKFV